MNDLLNVWKCKNQEKYAMLNVDTNKHTHTQNKPQKILQI